MKISLRIIPREKISTFCLSIDFSDRSSSGAVHCSSVTKLKKCIFYYFIVVIVQYSSEYETHLQLISKTKSIIIMNANSTVMRKAILKVHLEYTYCLGSHPLYDTCQNDVGLEPQSPPTCTSIGCPQRS